MKHLEQRDKKHRYRNYRFYIYKRRDARPSLWADLEKILLIIFLALLLRTFVFSIFQVPSQALFMVPTLIPGDLVFVYKLPFGVRVPLLSFQVEGRSPQRGEVVVFSSSSSLEDASAPRKIRRIVGLEGDRVEGRLGGPLMINGRARGETQGDRVRTTQILTKDLPPFVVPRGRVLVLGDASGHLSPSHLETVLVSQVEGKAVLVGLSVSFKQSILSIDWGRFFLLIH